MKSKNRNIAGLILAAGFSSRMRMFKPLLPINGQSFLSTIISKLNLVCNEIIVVTGYNEHLIKNEIETLNNKKVRTVFNKHFQDGMFTSLQVGIHELSRYDWVLYHFTDQPLIPNSFYKEFIEQTDSNYDWIQPIQNKRKGHPILLSNNSINLIIDSTKDSNLKIVSSSNEIKKKFWECNYPEIFIDIDTDENYQNLAHLNMD